MKPKRLSYSSALPSLTVALSLTCCLLSDSQAHRGSRDLDRDGIPNIVDPDVDNDGILNGDDDNIDGGIAESGRRRGRYVGDRLPNDHPAERDMDGDGLADDSPAERDIDGDGKLDDSPDEFDIDGDGRDNDDPDEMDIDGDGKADDSPIEFDIDGDGRRNHLDDDIDGDGIENASDSDDDGDGRDDSVDDSPSGATPGGVTGGSVSDDGSAPADLVGLTLIVHQRNGGVEANLVFASATSGSENDPDGDVDSFTYSYAPDASTASLVLQFKPDKWDEYDLEFTTGAYTRREFKDNALDDVDTGTFVIDGEGGGTPPPTGGGGTETGGTAPDALTGETITVRQLNGVVEAALNFATGANGTENDPDGDIDPYSYTYTPNGATASLVLQLKSDKWDEYDLDFVSSTFVRREFKDNALDDTDLGTFEFGGIATDNPPAGGDNSPDDDGTTDQGPGDNPPAGGDNSPDDDGTPDQGPGDNPPAGGDNSPDDDGTPDQGPGDNPPAGGDDGTPDQGPGDNPPAGGDGGNGGVALATLTGKTFVIRQNNGAIEANLVFSSATAGSENDPDGDVDVFSYTYSSAGSTATLTLQFKPDKWDEYTLDFATGSLTRREFKDGELDDVDSGMFTEA